MHEELKGRLASANKCYFCQRNLFKSKTYPTNKKKSFI